MEAGANSFLGFVKSVLPNDKYILFCKLFRAPVVTNSFVKKVFEALEKVFEGKDTSESYNFRSKTAAADWEEYRKKIDLKGFFRGKGFEAMKTAINSILVVDLPSEQTTDRPSPYVYMLPVSKVVDFELNEKGDFEWVAFELGTDQVAVFDDEHFRTFQKDSKIGLSNITLINEIPHGLEVTPANPFWKKNINEKSKFIKCSPLTDQLDNLDWLGFFATSKKVLDMYAAYPVQWGYESDCTFETENTRCENGFLKHTGELFSFDQHTGEEVHDRGTPERFLLSHDGSLKDCPVCSEARLMGAGSFVEVPLPDEGEAAIVPPVGTIPVDKDSLEYNVTEMERLKMELYANITGFSGDPIQNEAVNELQVAAAFEQRTNVLLNLKQSFEAAQSWTVDIICKLRYDDLYIDNNINYGTKFYLFSPELLLSFYDAARASQLNDSILDTLFSEYLQAKYRTDPAMLHRMKVLNDLEPFRHSTKGNIQALYEGAKIRFEDCMIKLQFSDLIARFERENGNIVEFGSAINYGEKIKRINEVLKKYVEEFKPDPVEEPTPAEGDE